MHVYVNEICRKKRKKQASKVKETTQHTQGVTFLKKNELPWVGCAQTMTLYTPNLASINSRQLS